MFVRHTVYNVQENVKYSYWGMQLMSREQLFIVVKKYTYGSRENSIYYLEKTKSRKYLPNFNFIFTCKYLGK